MPRSSATFQGVSWHANRLRPPPPRNPPWGFKAGSSRKTSECNPSLHLSLHYLILGERVCEGKRLVGGSCRLYNSSSCSDGVRAGPIFGPFASPYTFGSKDWRDMDAYLPRCQSVLRLESGQPIDMQVLDPLAAASATCIHTPHGCIAWLQMGCL